MEDLRRFDAEKLIEMYGFERTLGGIRATKVPSGEVDNSSRCWYFLRNVARQEDDKVNEIFDILSQRENP